MEQDIVKCDHVLREGIFVKYGFLYPARVTDVGSKQFVGWSIGERMIKKPVREALDKALGFRISISRKYDCSNNALTESFWRNWERGLSSTGPSLLD